MLNNILHLLIILIKSDGAYIKMSYMDELLSIIFKFIDLN